MKVYISKNDLRISLSIIFAFPLLGLMQVAPALKYVYTGVSLLILVAGLVSVIRQKIKIKTYIPFILYLYVIINTIFQHGDVIQAGSSFIHDCCAFIIVIYWIEKGKYIQLIINSSRIFDFFLIINAFHMLFTENGFGLTRSCNKIFILTADNYLAFYVIVFIIVHELRNKICPFSFIRNILYYAVILYEIYRGESATSYFILAVLILGVIFAKKIAFNRYFYIACGIIAFFNIFLLFIRKLSFMETIFAAMGKNTTISGRDTIWNLALALMIKSLLWGYGIFDNMYYVKIGPNVMEAHNMLLSYMLQGGIIMLALFVFMILLYGRGIRKSSSIVIRYLAIGVIAYLTAFLVEAPVSVPGFYFLLALCQMEEDRFEQDKTSVFE